MIFIREYSGTDVLDFGEYEYFEQAEFILNKLREKFDLILVAQNDSVYATYWQLVIDGYNFKLVNDNYGNYLRPDNENSKDYLHQIFFLLEIIFIRQY